MPLRRAQYRALDSEPFRLSMARDFVAAKLAHQRALLQRHNRERSDEGIRAAVEAIQRFLQTIEHKTSHASLMGVEGSATAAYFSGYRRLFDPTWRFENRNRRPPADPINVLLSLGYTLLSELAFGAVQAAGLDPYAGFLHEVAYNRPALALDLVEEFRPVVDGVALWAANSGQVTLQDFSPGPKERPVVFSAEGLRRYLKAFETRMEQRFTHPIRQQQLSMRQCIFEQARQVANRISENRPGYTAMGFR